MHPPNHPFPVQPLTTMRAATRDRYGGPEVLSVREVPRPAPGPRQVLIQVHATSVTAGDWLLLIGRPYLIRLVYGLFSPKHHVVGLDVAGRVEAVGDGVTRFKPGDAVFGELISGACAEYACASEDQLSLMPAGLDFHEAAALPIAATTALQGLRDAGRLQPGQKVLIIGASGGVGCLAVQIAKSLGAEVTAVCSARNAEWVRGLGADHVLDYATQDFADGSLKYDVIFDLVGDRSIRDCQRALTSDGTFVSSASRGSAWLGPIPRLARGALAGLFSRQRFVPFAAKSTPADFDTIRALVDAGKLRPVIDRRHSLDDVADAFRAQGAGHARGRGVIVVRETR